MTSPPRASSEWDAETLDARSAPTAERGSAGYMREAPGALESAQFGRYRLGAELGRGGMGVVYEAFDPELDRRVAIKLLLRPDSPDLLARLSREAQAVAQLNHPNVVRVFDVGVSAGRPFIVMEFITGTTVARWLETRPRWRAVVQVFCAAAQGLAAAHAVGLVHRDFKPGNVLLDETGGVRVLDFGLARPHGEASESTIFGTTPLLSVATLTQTGVAMGTPAYMSPEQHLGQRVTEAADIFAFGVSLYEGLCGGLPFRSRRMHRLLLQKRAGVAERPPTRRIPEAVYAVVRRCLAFDPAARYGSMDEVVSALSASVPRTRPWVLGALGVAAFVGAAITATVDASPSAPIAVPERPTSVDRSAEAEALELVAEVKRLRNVEMPPDALGVAYASLFVAAWSGSDAAYARALEELGITLRDVGRATTGVPILRAAVDKYVAIGDGRSAVSASVSLVYCYDADGFEAEATEVLREAKTLVARFGLENDARTKMRYLVGEAVAQRRSDPRAARRAREAALELRRTHPDLQTTPGLASLVHGMAIDELAIDPVSALGHFSMAYDLLIELGEPADGAHALTAEIGMAEAELRVGDAAACIAHARHVFDAAGELRVQHRADAAATLANCHRNKGELDEALVWADRALAIADLDALPPRYQIALLNAKANVLLKLERYDEAEPLLQRLVVISEADSDAGNHSNRIVLVSLAECVRMQGDAARAASYYRRALEIPNEFDDPPSSILRARLGLGITLVENGEYREAIEVLMLPEVDEVSDETSRMATATAKGYRAEARWNLGEADALDLAREALAELAAIPTARDHHDSLQEWIDQVQGLERPDAGR